MFLSAEEITINFIATLISNKAERPRFTGAALCVRCKRSLAITVYHDCANIGSIINGNGVMTNPSPSGSIWYFLARSCKALFAAAIRSISRST